MTEAGAVQGETLRELHAARSCAVRAPFPPLVLRVMAGEMKWQRRIGSRDPSAAISGAEVGQAQRNGGRASHAARGTCWPPAPEGVLRLSKTHRRRSGVGDRPGTPGRSSSNLGKDSC